MGDEARDVSEEFTSLTRLENAVLGGWDYESNPPKRAKGLLERFDAFEGEWAEFKRRLMVCGKWAAVPLAIVFLRSVGVPTDHLVEFFAKTPQLFSLLGR